MNSLFYSVNVSRSTLSRRIYFILVHQNNKTSQKMHLLSSLPCSFSENRAKNGVWPVRLNGANVRYSSELVFVSGAESVKMKCSAFVPSVFLITMEIIFELYKSKRTCFLQMLLGLVIFSLKLISIHGEYYFCIFWFSKWMVTAQGGMLDFMKIYNNNRGNDNGHHSITDIHVHSIKLHWDIVSGINVAYGSSY